jgi:aspartate aminotransferase
MDIQLSERITHVKPSAIRTIMARALELKKAGHDVLDLSIGEPDFDTPDYIKQAAIKAIHDGFTKYTPVDGIMGLKEAIVGKFARENQLTYEAKNILVSTGGRQCLMNLCEALLNPEHEVIIPTPSWVTYYDIVMLAGAKPVTIKTDMHARFKITATQLKAAITPNTRLLLLNSPSNPSGVAYTRQELTELANVLLQHPHIIIASDDMYEHFMWGKEPFCNILNVCPELYERTIILNGVSKTYAMTGWRIGYCAGNPHLINAMKNVQTQATANANSIAQVAAQAALTGPQNCINEMRDVYKQRHDIVIKEINNIPGIECLPADGTFYVFPCIEKAMQKLGYQHDTEFVEYLLNEAKVAVVPGSAFGTPGYMRISYATKLEILEKAIMRIRKAIEK